MSQTFAPVTGSDILPVLSTLGLDRGLTVTVGLREKIEGMIVAIFEKTILSTTRSSYLSPVYLPLVPHVEGSVTFCDILHFDLMFLVGSVQPLFIDVYVFCVLFKRASSFTTCCAFSSSSCFAMQ